MTTEALTPLQAGHVPTDDLRWASAEILRITVAQMRAWEADAARLCILPAQTDEEAWEGTELDVRRTVL